MVVLGTHELRDHECQEDSTIFTSILPPLPNINQVNLQQQQHQLQNDEFNSHKNSSAVVVTNDL